jgi:predicted transposase YbfD/YdcC
VLKENQPLTLEAVVVSFADPWTPREQVVEGDRHGDRQERRTLEASSEVVAYLAESETGAEEGQTGDWPGLGQVCRLHREVEYVRGRRAGEKTSEWASALTSLTAAQAHPSRLLQVWRGQWQIENGLHYVRDVTWGEDASQIRCGQGPAAFAAVRNTALGLLRLAKKPNVAAAQRRYAMYPVAAVALLGITLPLLA